MHGNAGADNNQVLILKRSLTVAACLNRYAVIQQGWNLIPELVWAFRIRNRNSRTTRLEKKR
jgi:hypothetical protein